MKISVRHVGKTIIEMTVEDVSAIITVDVADMKGIVPKDLIYDLREIADELELHNDQLRAGLL